MAEVEVARVCAPVHARVNGLSRVHAVSNTLSRASIEAEGTVQHHVAPNITQGWKRANVVCALVWVMRTFVSGGLLNNTAAIATTTTARAPRKGQDEGLWSPNCLPNCRVLLSVVLPQHYTPWDPRMHPASCAPVYGEPQVGRHGCQRQGGHQLDERHDAPAQHGEHHEPLLEEAQVWGCDHAGDELEDLRWGLGAGSTLKTLLTSSLDPQGVCWWQVAGSGGAEQAGDRQGRGVLAFGYPSLSHGITGSCRGVCARTDSQHACSTPTLHLLKAGDAPPVAEGCGGVRMRVLMWPSTNQAYKLQRFWPERLMRTLVLLLHIYSGGWRWLRSTSSASGRLHGPFGQVAALMRASVVPIHVLCKHANVADHPVVLHQPCLGCPRHQPSLQGSTRGKATRRSCFGCRRERGGLPALHVHEPGWGRGAAAQAGGPTGRKHCGWCQAWHQCYPRLFETASWFV